jgi:lysophospholipase L1-like esterase
MTEPPPARRRPSLGQKLLLVSGSIAFVVLACEVVTRMLVASSDRKALAAWQDLAERKLSPPPGEDMNLAHAIRLAKNPRIVYELIPNLTGRFVGAPLQTNAQGFRGPELPVQKPLGTFRIVGIGDSVMFGQGVDDQDGFLRQLERILRAKLPGRNVEVINTAVPGYNTAMAVATLADKGLAFAPDLVLYHFVSNDLDLPNFLWQQKEVWALDRSFLWEQLQKAWAPRDPWTDRPWRIETYGARFRDTLDKRDVPPAYRDMVGRDSFLAELQKLRALADQHGFRVLVTANWDNPPYVAASCTSAGLALLPTDPALRQYLSEHGIAQYRGSPLTINKDDPHPSALGHRIIAETIAGWLDQNGWLRN